MTGDLTNQGVTRPVELDATVEGAELDPWGTMRVGIRVAGRSTARTSAVTWQKLRNPGVPRRRRGEARWRRLGSEAT